MGEKMSVAEGARTIQKVRLSELDGSLEPGKKLLNENMDLIRNVKVKLAVSVGNAELSVKELFDLRENAVLPLNRGVREPVEVVLEGKVVARGNLVAVGENFGVQITEIVGT